MSGAYCAHVAVRASRGGGDYYHPVRVYLLYCRCDASGKVVVPPHATRAPGCVYVRENKRARRRMRILLAQARFLADNVNAGRMTFEDAAHEFALSKHPQ